MKEKKPAKSKRDEQAQLLDLLRTILPRVAPDPALAEKIYSAVEAELRAKNRVQSFEKFCERIELPDLETKTLEEVKQQLTAGFGEADLEVARRSWWMSRCQTVRNFTAAFPCVRWHRTAVTSRKSL